MIDSFHAYLKCAGNHDPEHPEHAATHVALFDDGHEIAYCCAVFDHDWPKQRLVAGRTCQKELKVETRSQQIRRWIWRKRSKTAVNEV